MTVHPLARDGAISIVVRQRRDTAFVRIAGDVDPSGSAALTEANDALVQAGPSIVWLDLAEVTFAGSTLVNFIVRLRNAMKDGTRLTVCRATPMALRVMTVCGLQRRLEFTDQIPDDWPQAAATDTSETNCPAPIR